MPHQIDDKAKQKWSGYFFNGRVKTGLKPLTESLIKRQLSAWQGMSVCPDKPDVQTRIGEVRENSLILRLRGGKSHNCPFHEIIDADFVTRFWLAKGQAPKGDDFRNPDAAIGVQSVNNNYYAPALAQRIRQTNQNNVDAELDSTFADESDIEGLRTEVRQSRTKRSRKLRDKALESARGVCCVCERDYSKVLGGRGIRVLQVHHRKQLSSRVIPSKTMLRDLAVVCANCHLLLHLDRDKALTVKKLKAMLKADG